MCIMVIKCVDSIHWHLSHQAKCRCHFVHWPYSSWRPMNLLSNSLRSFRLSYWHKKSGSTGSAQHFINSPWSMDVNYLTVPCRASVWERLHSLWSPLIYSGFSSNLSSVHILSCQCPHFLITLWSVCVCSFPKKKKCNLSITTVL